MDIDGNALVIGGSGGIGRACAILLAKEGASGLMIGDVDMDTAKRVVADCLSVATNSHFRAEAVQVNVTKEDQVRNIFVRMVEMFGRVDYCVNCAGIGVDNPRDIASLQLSEFQRFLDVNTTGTFLVTREASVMMRSQKLRAWNNRSPSRGAIVNLCSASSLAAAPGILPYTTSKHAQLGLTKNSALENAAYGIRVNAVCPSWTDTPMVQRAIHGIEGLADLITSKVPIGRMASPDEIADVILFALSPRSSFMTGSALVVDGGVLAGY